MAVVALPTFRWLDTSRMATGGILRWMARLLVAAAISSRSCRRKGETCFFTGSATAGTTQSWDGLGGSFRPR